MKAFSILARTHSIAAQKLVLNDDTEEEKDILYYFAAGYYTLCDSPLYAHRYSHID